MIQAKMTDRQKKIAAEVKQHIDTAFTTHLKKQFEAEAVAEYRFDKIRKWRFDYAIPELKIAIEIEGGSWVQGRHTRAAGFVADMEKYNAAEASGWHVLRCLPQQQFTNEFMNTIKKMIQNVQGS